MFITILCLIMGITLFLFFLYHCSLVKRGLTTNEKVKISNYCYGVDLKIKELTKIHQSLISEEIHSESEEKKTEIKENITKTQLKIKVWIDKLNHLKLFGNKGFLQNIKEIFNEK